MKIITKVSISIVAITVTAMFFTNATQQAHTNTSGGPSGLTGSPGDGATCTNCHSGPTPIPVSGWITSNIPAGGYTPGTTYTITATATRNNHSKFGFEVSPQNVAGTKKGTLILTNTTQTQLVGSGAYITHTSSGVSGTNTKSWSFNWTAPVAGTGAVNFYGAFNVTNNSGTSLGDTMFLSTLPVVECATPATPTAIAGNTTICSGTVNTYSITAVSGATSYTWTLPSGWSGTSTTTSISTTAGTTGGTISVVANSSCGSSVAKTLSVTVNAKPTITASSATICAGQSASLTASGGTTYSWSTGSTANPVSVTPTSASTYSVTGTALGCTASATAKISISSTLGITVNSKTICAGQTASLTANGGTTYSWSTGSTSNPLSVTVTSPSTYTVTGTSGGCTGSAVATVSVNTVNTNVTVSGIMLTAVATNSTYQWVDCNNGNNPIAGQTSQSYTPTANGNYAVIVTDNTTSCSGTSSCNLITSVGINEINKLSKIIISPNPFNSQTIITFAEEENHATVKIIDIVGKEIKSTTISGKQLVIEKGEMKEGIYFIQIMDENKNIITKKIIVQ